jgi:hypothetical protein
LALPRYLVAFINYYDIGNFAIVAVINYYYMCSSAMFAVCGAAVFFRCWDMIEIFNLLKIRGEQVISQDMFSCTIFKAVCVQTFFAQKEVLFGRAKSWMQKQLKNNRLLKCRQIGDCLRT